MKNTSQLLLFGIALVTFLSGCGPTTTPVASPTAPAPPSALTPIVPSPTSTEVVPKGITIIVNSIQDNGPGTLRQAMQDAQRGDTITFDPAVFPAGNPATIALAGGLPAITQGYLTIDASDAGVILDGSTVQETSLNGMTVSSNGNVIRGMQIVSFPGAGIALIGGARDNTIGGDRTVGSGTTGQGNLFSGNKNQGIGIWDASHNLIMGNFIGTDSSGTQAWGNANGIHINGGSYNQVTGNLVSGNTGYGIELCCTTDTNNNTLSGNLVGTAVNGVDPLGNLSTGISIHDSARDNTIGPDNLIAANHETGIVISADSPGNTITRNRIHDNSSMGIDIQYSGETQLPAPHLAEFDINAGSVSGWACPGCIVEIFSDQESEGAQFEGQARTDAAGNFTFVKGSAFAGPNLTATATDGSGNSSEFSPPTTGMSRSITFQAGNPAPKTLFQSLQSGELTDNRIGAVIGWPEDCQEQYLEDELFDLGAKRVKISNSEIEPKSVLGTGTVTVDWSTSEFTLSEGRENCIQALLDNGMTITYILSFWDKANHPGGWEPPVSRFRTQEEIQRYLEYVRFIVQHYKGRIRYYEIWNEPNNKPPLQWIQLNDYINLVKQTVPVIKQEDPQAKVVIGGIVLQNEEDRAYLFGLLKSELMTMVDVVSWHAMFGVSPENMSEYYYGYSAIVESIKKEAEAHGFKGEYWGDELIWRDPDCSWCYPGDPLYSNIVSAKYHARGIVIQLGLDLNTQVTGNSSIRPNMFFAVKNLDTLLAGNRPLDLPVEVQTTATLARSYGFSLPNGDQLLAIWNDGVAVDSDPGVAATLIIPGLAGWTATGIDVLSGLEQELVTNSENGKLVIRDFNLKDYPIIIQFSR